VLVVDDNEMARTILQEQLGSFGMIVNTADSGENAISEIKSASNEKPYDLVFMDWRMPKMDGLEAAKRIINDKDMVQTPMTIMVSAFGREEVFQKAEKIGVDAFLIKPINQSLLLDTVMQVFGMNKIDSITRVNKIGVYGGQESQITGARVLLVEDNALNQEVACEIIKSFGVVVEIANNGKEAVDMVDLSADSYYDAVLMDIQMPVMGGYVATRIIRGNDRFNNLPIIAMTAHAMQGVKEDCLNAGMNDYVSKPIDPVFLLSVLQKWIKPKSEKQASFINNSDDAQKKSKFPDDFNYPSSSSGGFAESSSDYTQGENIDNFSEINAEDKVVDNFYATLPSGIPGIDIEGGLARLGGNRKLYLNLLKDFAPTYLNCTSEIRNALTDGDKSAASRTAHTVKGVAGNISLKSIYDAAAVLESKINQTDAIDIQTHDTEEIQFLIGKLESV
jgi:CheY-like chemotaxis protein/HPt (histidine-containing phosphotransfer) domain-containing protein